MAFASDATHTSTSYAFDISALGRRPLRSTITPLDPATQRRRDGTPRSVPIVRIESARLAAERSRARAAPVAQRRMTGPARPVPGRIPTSADSELLRAAVLFGDRT